MDRRSVHDNDARSSISENPNVFDDEYAVDDIGVSDGFRLGPVEHTPSHGFRQEVSNRSIPAYLRSTSGADGLPSRNSSRKSRSGADPFASPEDASIGLTPDRTTSIRSASTTTYAPSLAHRSVSSASTYAPARVQSPYASNNGPSHPYAMYPQGIGMTRTPSIVSSSTIRAPDRTAAAREGPAHPYMMYSQHVTEDSQEPVEQMQNHIPVGFAEAGQPYHRRLGADGEEQDIVGPDGHAEQLPPYSRYPEGGPQKYPLLGVPEMHEYREAPDNVAASQVPLMPAATHPESSTGDRGIPLSQVEQMESHDSGSSEKSWKEKSWKEKRKTRFCGIPLWWMLLAGGIMVFLAIVLGGAIGGFVAKNKIAVESSAPVVTVTSTTALYHASQISTPTSMPTLPAGNFALDMTTPQSVQASCLTDTSQAAAWSCNIPDPVAAAISILRPANNPNGPASVYLYYTSENTTIRYGTQTPEFNQHVELMTVIDLDEPHRGPAYYFQSYYNKLVVVHPDDLHIPSTSKGKRSGSSSSGPLLRRGVVPVAEKPWFCYWNGTFVEGFIYATENSTESVGASQTIATTTTTTTTGAGSSVPTVSVSPTAGTSTSNRVSSATITPAAATTTSASLPLTSSFTTTFSARDNGDPHLHSAPSSWVNRRNTLEERDADDLPTSGGIPYIVKIEERRVPNSVVQPYCVQMQVLENGYAGVVSDQHGPIQFKLKESDPSFAAYEARESSKRRSKRDPAGGCHCQWTGT
ncbi:hypothetical protein LTR66_010540 [Elasticomyces elasticus]|nr:hypothetical protein LTR66_010540 [Elasticomyces elasticus]